MACRFAATGHSGDFIKPLIESQAKQQKSFVFKLANFQKTLTKNLTLKNQKLSKESRVAHSDDEKPIVKAKASTEQQRYSESYARSKRVSSQTLTSDESEIYTSDEDSSEVQYVWEDTLGWALNSE